MLLVSTDGCQPGRRLAGGRCGACEERCVEGLLGISGFTARANGRRAQGWRRLWEGCFARTGLLPPARQQRGGGGSRGAAPHGRMSAWAEEVWARQQGQGQGRVVQVVRYMKDLHSTDEF